MSFWSHGYNAENSYVSAFFPQNTPCWLDFSNHLAGGVTPSVANSTPRLRYLDLGCGTGFGLAAMAAMYPDIDFVGVDFMAEHIVQARAWAQQAQLSNVVFIEADFMVLQHQWASELGCFDYVVGHGILSWVAPDVRDALVRCLEHAVVPGGLVMLSYNTMPAWGDALFFQHLASSRQKFSAATGLAALNETVVSFNELIRLQAAPVQMYPKTVSRIQGLNLRPDNYLVQEYMHRNWQPLWPSHVEEMLSKARLQRAGNAELKDLWIQTFLSPELQNILKPHAGTPLVEDWIDYLSVKSFRRDIFQRGFVKANPLAQRASVMNTRISAAFTDMPRNWTYKFSMGEISAAPEKFQPIYEAVFAGTKSIGQLAALPEAKNWELATVLHVVTMALSKGDFMLSRKIEGSAAAGVRRFNQAIAKASCQGAKGNVLASAKHAIGVAAPEHFLYLLDAVAEGVPLQIEALGRALENRLHKLSIAVENLPMEFNSRDTSVRYKEVAEIFIKQVLPQWERLGSYSNLDKKAR